MYSYARRNSTARKNRQNQHYKEHTTKLQCSHTQIKIYLETNEYSSTPPFSKKHLAGVISGGTFGGNISKTIWREHFQKTFFSGNFKKTFGGKFFKNTFGGNIQIYLETNEYSSTPPFSKKHLAGVISGGTFGGNISKTI
jgi:hypothetical protein